MAARSFLDYHQRLKRAPSAPAAADPAVCSRWRDALASTPVLSEHQALAMFDDFGLPVVDCQLVESAEAAVDAAETLGYPVALKTAVEGIHHKSDVDWSHPDCARLHIGGATPILRASFTLDAAVCEMRARTTRMRVTGARRPRSVRNPGVRRPK